MGKRGAGGWPGSEEGREEDEKYKERRERNHNVDEIEHGKALARSKEALLAKWCFGPRGMNTCTPLGPEHFVSHWNLQCETKRRAEKRATRKSMPTLRFAGSA